MFRRSILAILFLLASAWLPRSAQALVIFGEIAPGEVRLGPNWAEQRVFADLIRLRRAVGGQFTDAPTWWDGHFSAEYYYQGREPDLQLLIDTLDAVHPPHCKVVVVDGEAFWDGNGLVRRKESLAYDWSLAFFETRMKDPAKYKFDGKTVINEPVVILRIYLGERLNRAALRIPQRLLDAPRIPAAGQVSDSTLPLDALHALARAWREN